MLFAPKPVLKYDQNGVFRKRYKSEQEACEKLNIDSGNLCRALRKGICAGGFYWRYDSGDKIKIKICIRERCGKKIAIFKNKLYLCTCRSITEASELIKLPIHIIRKYIRNSSTTKEGFKFKEEEKL